jgi:hypothetical protein
MKLTTSELAYKFNTSPQAVRQANHMNGHFKNYKPVGKSEPKGTFKNREIMWEIEKNGEENESA